MSHYSAVVKGEPEFYVVFEGSAQNSVKISKICISPESSQTENVGIDFFKISKSRDQRVISGPTVLFDSKSKSRVRFDSFPSDVTSDDDVIDAVSADTGFPLSVKISNLYFLSAALAQMPLLAFKCRLPCFELNKSAPGRAKAMFDIMFPLISRSWLECISRGREYTNDLFYAVFHTRMVEKFRLSASRSTAYNIVGELLQGNLIKEIIGRESISVTDLLRGFKILEISQLQMLI